MVSGLDLVLKYNAVFAGNVVHVMLNTPTVHHNF